MNILEVQHLSKVYGKDEMEVRALDDVSFTVAPGETVALVCRSHTTSERSGLPLALMPQCRPAARKPAGAVTPPSTGRQFERAF